MKLILIDGGPASGKNTLGKLLVGLYQNNNIKTVLLDLDTFVEELNPKWIWENEKQKATDQLKARDNIAKEIDRYINENYIVIVIGERFLTKNNINEFLGRLKTSPPVYLYHLNVPFALRQKRLNVRGPHTLIDLEQDQKDRDKIKIWPGYIYQNINKPEEDVLNIFKLIQDNKGLVKPIQYLLVGYPYSGKTTLANELKKGLVLLQSILMC